MELYRIESYGRNFALYDSTEALVCLTVYRKGAVEVIRRLGGEVVKKVVKKPGGFVERRGPGAYFYRGGKERT